MPRCPTLQDALKAAKAAGLSVARVVVDRRAGKFELVVAGEKARQPEAEANLDAELAEFEARNGQG